jgi:hypothetical protein
MFHVQILFRFLQRQLVIVFPDVCSRVEFVAWSFHQLNHQMDVVILDEFDESSIVGCLMTGPTNDLLDQRLKKNTPKVAFESDPLGANGGSDRVRRGGSWFQNPIDARAANRDSRPPGFTNHVVGFRLARTAP